MMVLQSIAPAIPITSYANAGGTGDRTALVTVTSNITLDSGTFDNLVDGSFVADATGSIDLPGVNSTPIPSGAYIRFDFGASVFKYIDELKVYFGGAAPNMGSWNWQASNDASSWTTLGSFTWDASIETVTLSGLDLTGYRYFQIVKPSSGDFYSGNDWFKEVEFKIAPGA